MKKFIFNLTLLSFMIIFLALTKARAQESFSIEPSLLYYSGEDGTDTKFEETITSIDTKMGYTFTQGFFLGVRYLMFSQDFGSSDTSTSAYGPVLGYRNNGFHINFTYFMAAEEEQGSNNLEAGTGMGLDFGYTHMVTGFFGIGAQITYYSLEMEENNGQILTTNFERTELYPALALKFAF